MAYNQFAYWYDDLNIKADYDSLVSWIVDRLNKEGICKGIVADLGCGTGEVTLRLSKSGYDMIAVDQSYDMLSVLRDKMTREESLKILLLQQDLSELDLYGTIAAAVSTFDTFNHLSEKKVNQALARAALFLEPGGLFVFDVNTPYKNINVLADNVFDFEGNDNIRCEWKNTYDPEQEATRLVVTLKKGKEILFEESFVEYIYGLDFWKEALDNSGLLFVEAVDGETFLPLSDNSQRYLVVAKKTN